MRKRAKRKKRGVRALSRLTDTGTAACPPSAFGFSVRYDGEISLFWFPSVFTASDVFGNTHALLRGFRDAGRGYVLME